MNAWNITFVLIAVFILFIIGLFIEHFFGKIISKKMREENEKKRFIKEGQKAMEINGQKSSQTYMQKIKRYLRHSKNGKHGGRSQ